MYRCKKIEDFRTAIETRTLQFEKLFNVFNFKSFYIKKKLPLQWYLTLQLQEKNK